jgi:hypothetical protein
VSHVFAFIRPVSFYNCSNRARYHSITLAEV